MNNLLSFLSFMSTYRIQKRHDGTKVIQAKESVLSEGMTDLQPMGIRRWRLQKILFEELQAQGISIRFRKKITGMDTLKSGQIVVNFEDTTSRTTSLLLAADGRKSPIRNLVAGGLSKLLYTGTTCIYGSADIAREERGICFPSSVTTKCHGCFYPTGPNEQCFQFHIPTDPKSEDEGGWSALTAEVGKEECKKLATELEKDGWDETYLKPLKHVIEAIKVPLAVLDPPLKSFVYDRVVLVGDSAHPPVPYLGQGAQQGLEDAGTLSLVLKKICLDLSGNLSMLHIDEALKIYSEIRVPRTNEILNNSQGWGDVQQMRAKSDRFNEVKEEMIRRDVFFHESIHQILPGVTYDYEEEVANILQNKPLLTVQEEAVY
jgi:2-polyprenyl-6-methoxyphenol hydroxylase-like FAD-dependent oxidoreductase